MKYRIPIIILLVSLTFQTVKGQIKNNWGFKDELISYMQFPKDTVFIQDRKKIEKVSGLKCNDSTVIFYYKSKRGDSLIVKIENKKFIAARHSLYLSDTVFKLIHNEKRIDYLISKNLIDEKPAFGIDGGYPKKELKSLKIKWGNKWLSIPNDAFHNLYDTDLCHKYSPVEVYITKDNKSLYLYISGSDGAGSYAVKLIFDRTKYLTRIVNINECSNQYNFLDGLGECK